MMCICPPGRKSSVLIAIARAPPIIKAVNERIMYKSPTSVWWDENNISHIGRGFLTSNTTTHSPLDCFYLEWLSNKSILFCVQTRCVHVRQAQNCDGKMKRLGREKRKRRRRTF